MKAKETFLTIDPPSGWKYGFPKAVTQEQYKQITDLKEWCIDNGYPKAEADSYGDYFHIQINGDLSFMNKETSTLYTTMSNNIGQVKKENAQKEIERLNKQDNTKSWRIDESDFMFVEDETDDDVNNPCEKIEGYVWITCEPMTTREQAIAWKNTLDIDTQIDLCIKYNDVCKLHGRLMSNLIGREIEGIYNKEVLEPKRQEEWQESQVNCRYTKPNAKEFKQFDESLFKAYIDKLPESESLNMIKIIYESKLPDCKFKTHLDKWFKL